MLEAAIASVAGVAGIVLWWLKNRSKTRTERDDAEIEYRRRLRDTELDNWWRTRP